MKKTILALAIIATLVSCGKKEYDMNVIGNVRGLKTGTIYLQTVKDSVLTNIDSLVVKGGDTHFNFGVDLPEIDIFYLFLNKKDNDSLDDRIFFFGEKGTININTSVERFELDASIKGSKNSAKFQEFSKIMKQFRAQGLDLIKESFDAQKDGGSTKINEVSRKSKNLTKRTYLFATNFAVNNKDHIIAPYIALTEIYDANPKLLDTIYTVLTPEVKESKYGKVLNDYLKKVKTETKE